MKSNLSWESCEPGFEYRSPLRIVLPLALALGLLGLISNYLLVSDVRQRLVTMRRHGIQDLTRVAVDIVDRYAALAAAGRIPLDQAQKEAAAHLKRMRFGPRDQGYFWISDRTLRVIMHPHRPDLEGQAAGQFTDPAERRPFAAFAEAVGGPEGAGFVEYAWQGQDDAGRTAPKIAHVRLFAGWDWIVGTGIYLEDVRGEITGLSTRLAYGGLGALAALGMLTAYLIWQGVRTERRRHDAWTTLYRRGEERRAILESTPHPVVVYDHQGAAQYVNPAFTRTFGWSLAEILGQRIDFVPRSEHEKTLAGIRQAYEQGAATIQTRRLTREGRVLDVQISAAAYHDMAGRPIGMVVNLVDTTAQKRAEADLRESEAKYRRLVENAGDAIFITQDGIIKFANQRMLDTSGYDARSLARIPFADMIHPQDREVILQRHGQRLRGEAVKPQITFRGYNRQRDLLWLELNAVNIEWEGRPAVLNFLRDITEKKRLEAEIAQAHRLESLGTLAGGIAHDFNNLLMGILGNAALMRTDLDPGHAHHQRLADIETLVHNGAELTRQLLGFARGGKYKLQPTDLNGLVRAGVALFRRTRREITVRENYQADLWPVEVDRSQINQVLLNLMVNAWQSMPQGGQLTITTANQEWHPEQAAAHGLSPGRFVCTTVSDTGVGMDEATCQRIFEPFFTTRQMGHGTGLGLASAYGIIRNHGGLLTVSSCKGVGSSFAFHLPATANAVSEDAGPAADKRRGHETILLVDDEPMVLEVSRELLQRLGYTVFTADSGQAALDLLAQPQASFDLVILDMIMPGLSGAELFDGIRRLKPNQPVLLASGYSQEGEAKSILERGCDGFIQKPFDLALLSRRIREILDRR